MSLPDQTPKLPKLPFLIGDAILLGAAWYIANRVPGALTVSAMAAVTVCVGLAAIMGAVPFLTDYARKQDESLDERQRGLEALSRTINSAAEQISIAANGLNELTDLTHKNLKQAEQLPHKLQDKIAEFNAQLDNARENDREELEKEIVELRTSETERLQSISEKIHKAIVELSRLDAATQQHSAGQVEQNERSQAALAKAQENAARAFNDATTALVKQLSSAQANALAAIDRTLSDRTALAVAAIEAAVARAVHAAPSASTTNADLAEGQSEVAANSKPSEASSDVASPPKRPRKARREDSPASGEAAGDGLSEKTATPAETAVPTSQTESSVSPPPFFEPAPIPAEAIPHIEPVAPASAEPFPLPAPAHETVPPVDIASIEAPIKSVPSEAQTAETGERPARKRAARKNGAEPTADLPFELAAQNSSSDDPMTTAEMMEQVISSDGATRLIATSYIGIGNRLFIRGAGPGLSWDKGVPLQFVSIGKWRWETADASAPIQFKLYKNDEVECPGLGALTLEPGHQQEVIAKF